MNMSKKVLAGFVAALAIGGTAFAAVLIATLPTTISVNEAFSTTETGVSASGFPGETVCDSVDVNNAASVPLNALFDFSESSNPNAVVYTVNTPNTVSLSPGSNSVNICFTMATDSPAGTISGDASITRVV